jgi:hypothetical protein
MNSKNDLTEVGVALPQPCSVITVTMEAHRQLQDEYRHIADYCRDLEIKLAAATAGHPEEIEEEVIAAIRERRERGRRKYETTMERDDLTTLQWAQHAQEEAMDLAIYLQRLKRDLQNVKEQATADE